MVKKVYEMAAQYRVGLVTVMFLLVGCKKHNSEGQVEMYVLKSYQLVAGRCQIDGAASTLDNNPFVSNSDIISYNKADYRFSLSSAAIQKIKAFGIFQPFVVTVNRQVVYYAVFKPGISSSSCDHSITMDIDWANANGILMKLGYPGQLQGVVIDDQRNNSVLLQALSAQGKLK
jgi:hypothetical protein